MRRVGIGLCALLCVLVGTTVALAATTTVKSSGQFKARVLQTSGGKNTYAGQIKDKVNGKGAMVGVNTLSGDTLAGPFTAFFAKGTISGTATSKFTQNPDGSATLTDGKLKITKGTGAFKGSKGSGTYSGTTAADGLITINYKTRIKQTK